MAQAERRGAAVTGVWPGDLRCAPSHEHYVEVVVAAGGQFDRRFDLACEVALHVSSRLTYIDSCPVTPKNSTALWEP